MKQLPFELRKLKAIVFCMSCCFWLTSSAPAWARDSVNNSEPIAGSPTMPAERVDPTQYQGAPIGEPEARPPRGMEFDESTLNALRQQPVASNANRGATPGIVTSLPPLAVGPDASAPPLSASFQGIADTSMIPADPILAVGTQRIIQAVNSSVRITDRSGGGASTTTLKALLGIPTGSNGTQFDPWVHYDHFAGRFVLVCITTNSARTDGWYIVAVSRNSTPTTSSGSWYVYYLRNDLDGATNTSFWGDYEKLGFDNTYFYITSNQFNSAGVFQYAKIRRYPKSQFYTGQTVSGLEWTKIKNAFPVNGTYYYAFTIQPAVHFGTPGTGYLTSCWNGSGVNRVSVFRITGNTLTSASVAGWTAWTIPNSARQKGSSATLDSGDARLLGAVYQNSRLYTCHTVRTANAVCAAHYLGINTSNNTKAMDATIWNSAIDFYYPAVTVSSGGNLGTVVNFSAPAEYPGIAYTQIGANGAIQSPLGVLKRGEASYYKTYGGTKNRWGDYNGICRDPTNGLRIWFNAMYAKTPANTWGTWVGSGGLSASPVNPAVQASFDELTNTLMIVGDDAGDKVRVTRRRNRVTVTGVARTRVNGESSAAFDIPTILDDSSPISLTANLGGGNDELTLLGMSLQDANVLLGEGDDSLFVVLSSITDLLVDGGDGTDALVTTSSEVTNTSQVNIP